MKARHILGLAVLMAVAGSCKKNQNQDTSSFSASIEVDESRTYLDGMTVKWSEGDKIIVYGDGAPKTYTLSTGDGTQTATFTTTGGVQPASTYRAFYPASSCRGVSGDVFTFSMPAMQTYTANGFMNNLNPMAGKNDGNGGTLIGFKNAFAVLKLQTRGNVAVTKVEVTVPSGALYGNYTFDPTSGTTTYVDGGGSTITLNCGGGVALNENSDTDFYIVLPPGCLSGGFDVKYYRATNPNTPFATTSVPSNATGLNLLRNTIKRISLTAEAPVEYVYNLLPSAQIANWDASYFTSATDATHQGYPSFDITTNANEPEAFFVTKNTIELTHNHWYYLRWTSWASNKDKCTHDAYWPIDGRGSVVNLHTSTNDSNQQNGVAYFRKITKGNESVYTTSTNYPMKTLAASAYQVNSVIFKAEIFGSGNHQFRIDANNNKASFNYRLLCPMLIDLTEYYGPSYNGGDVINTLGNKAYFEGRHEKDTW